MSGERQVIKRFIMHAKKTAFIVEHDFIMAAYLADRVIVYEGQPSVKAVARKPQSLVTGATITNPCLSCMQRCTNLTLKHFTAGAIEVQAMMHCAAM